MTVFQDQPNPSAVLLRAGELVVVSEEKDNKGGGGFMQEHMGLMIPFCTMYSKTYQCQS